MKKICKTCNKEFEAKNYNQNYCCNECRDVAITRTCARCGKEFKVSKPSVQTKFCSKSCAVSTCNEQGVMGKKSKKNKEKTIIKHTCSTCGKEFERTETEFSTKRNNYYCSSECYSNRCKNITTSQYDNENERFCAYCGKKLPDTYEGRIHKYCNQECYAKSKQNKVDLICDYCGKSFQKVPSLVNDNLNFCSRKCGSSYRLRARFDKDLNYSQFRKRLDSSEEYKDWENKVLTKDNNKCRICSSQENLHVHHIIPISNIVSLYKINNYDLELYNKIINDSLFNNINNGITLCCNCHDLCHYFGNDFIGPNTEK